MNNERGKAVWYKDIRGVWRKKVISKPFFFLCWIAHLSKIIVSGIPVCKPVENDAAHSAFLLSPGSPGSTLKALSKWELQLGRSFRKLFEKLLLGSRTTGKTELLSCALMDGCSFLSSEQKWRTLGVGGEGRRGNIQGNKIKVIQRILWEGRLSSFKRKYGDDGTSGPEGWVKNPSGLATGTVV